MPSKKLFVFDMDGTLLPGTTGMVEISKMTGHVKELEHYEIEYAEKRMDSVGFTSFLYEIWGNLSLEVSKEAFLRSPKIENIMKVTSKIAEQGHVSCLITASMSFFANHFYDYGFDYIYASTAFSPHTPLDMSKVLSSKDKPKIARELCQKLDLNFHDTVAFGDSVSDVHLFKELTHTVAVNGTAEIKSLARHQYQGNDLLEALYVVQGHGTEGPKGQ